MYKKEFEKKNWIDDLGIYILKESLFQYADSSHTARYWSILLFFLINS